MRINVKRLMLLIGFVCIFFIGCDDTKKMRFSGSEIMISEETKVPLILKNINIKEVNILSENENIVIVDNGIMYPCEVGETKVIATWGEQTISIDVLVLPNISIEEEVLYGDSLEYEIENEKYLDYNITFSNPSMIFKNGKFVTKGVGEVEITFELKENKRIFVKKKVNILPIKPILSADNKEVEMEEYFDFYMENYDSIDLFELTSSDESIVQIEDGNLGYALKPGKAIITAKLKSDKSYSSSIEVIVKYQQIEYSISKNVLIEEEEFLIDFYNYSSDSEFDIQISDENIIKKIGEKTYKTLKTGSASILVTLKADPNISKKIDLIVYSKEPIFDLYAEKISVGDSMKIKFLNYLNAEEFVWQISDENLVDFTNFTLIAKKAGTIIVSAVKKDNPNISAKISIIIEPKQAELLITSNNLFVGGEARLFINNLDELETNDFSKFNIIASDPEIVEINGEMVKALKLGKTLIKVESKENNSIKGEVEVNVIETSDVKDINGEPNAGELIIYSKDPKNYIHAGEFFQLYVDKAKDNSNYKWVSTNTKIATVNETGRVIAVSKGTTQIAAISKTNKEVKGIAYVTVYGEPNVDYAARLVKIATEEIGYREGSNNDTKYGEWYNLNYEPWCAMFVSWCANQAGISIDIIPKYCGCTAGRKWFMDAGLYQSRESGYLPKAGDIVFYRDTDETADISTHTGIVYACDGKSVYTIEGNTKDMCAKRSYLLSSAYILGYGTPDYPEFDGEPAIFEPGNPESGEHLPTT